MNRLIAPVVLAALLGACASPSGLAPRGKTLGADELAASRSLAMSPAEWPAEAWWSAYGDPQLDRLVAAALAGNPGLDAARARLDLALARASQSAAANGPQVGANIEGAQQRLSEHYIFPQGVAGTYTSLNRVALDFSLELDLWGRNRARLTAALGQARAAEAETAATRLAIAAAVTRSYFELDRLYQLRTIADATLLQREKLQELVRLRQKTGLDTRTELLQAGGSIEAARTERLGLDARIEIQRHQLAALCGQGPDATIDLAAPALHDASVAGVPASLPADLLGRRPDLVAQRWRVEASRQEGSAARAAFYPNVNLNAFIGFQSMGLSQLFEGGSRVLGAGPAIHLPVFDSGRLRAELAGRNAEEDAAIAQYNATLVDALREVADQLSQWRGATTEGESQRNAQLRYEDAWRLMDVRYRAGLSSYAAVLAAETPLLEQRRLAAELRTRRLDASAGLARALGGGYTHSTPEGNTP